MRLQTKVEGNGEGAAGSEGDGIGEELDGELGSLGEGSGEQRNRGQEKTEKGQGESWDAHQNRLI